MHAQNSKQLAATIAAFLLLCASAQAAPPVMEQITTPKGSGATIQVLGKGFMGATVVHVGSVAATFTAGNSYGQEFINAHADKALPPGTVAPVSVSNPEGTSAHEDYTYLMPQFEWKQNNTPLAYGKVAGTIAWGTFTWQTPAGATVACKTSEADSISNSDPEVQGSTTAQAQTVMFAPYECGSIAGLCPVEARVVPSGLPWSQTIGSEARTLEGVHLSIECPGRTSESFTGTITEELSNGGGTATNPPEAFVRSSSLSGLTVKGRMKMEGYGTGGGGSVPLISLEPTL